MPNGIVMSLKSGNLIRSLHYYLAQSFIVILAFVENQNFFWKHGEEWGYELTLVEFVSIVIG